MNSDCNQKRLKEAKNMTLAEMKRIKEERGYSFRQLSEYSGVPQITLQKIFSGETKSPRKATLQALEKVLTGREDLYAGKAYSYENASKSNLSPSAVCEESAAYAATAEAVDVTAVKRQGEFTIEDYRSLPDEKRFELIDGILYEMKAPGFIHQHIAAMIHMAFFAYIKNNKGPCIVLESPTDVQLDCDEKTMIQPDVLVVCDRSKIKEFGIFGAPDFVLEIISPSTRKKDMGIKMGKYAEAGVREYWIINPEQRLLIIYNFQDENWLPQVMPLIGSASVNIFDGELLINLDEISETIDEFGF